MDENELTIARQAVAGARTWRDQMRADWGHYREPEEVLDEAVGELIAEQRRLRAALDAIATPDARTDDGCQACPADALCSIAQSVLALDSEKVAVYARQMRDSGDQALQAERDRLAMSLEEEQELHGEARAELDGLRAVMTGTLVAIETILHDDHQDIGVGANVILGRTSAALKVALDWSPEAADG
jgi:hypothetical protein